MDYRANGNKDSADNTNGTLRGQLFLVRCWRDSVSDTWNLEPPIFLYENVIAGPRTGNFMHFHRAGITFPGGGVIDEEPELGRRMVVTLSWETARPTTGW